MSPFVSAMYKFRRAQVGKSTSSIASAASGVRHGDGSLALILGPGMRDEGERRAGIAGSGPVALGRQHQFRRGRGLEAVHVGYGDAGLRRPEECWSWSVFPTGLLPLS